MERTFCKERPVLEGPRSDPAETSEPNIVLIFKKHNEIMKEERLGAVYGWTI